MKRWIADLATTNFRIVISLGLAVLLVVVILIGVVIRVEMQTEIVWALFAFVAGMLGIDVTQFSIKRKTEILTPPQVTAENATATITATAPPNPTPIPQITPANPPAADPDPDKK